MCLIAGLVSIIIIAYSIFNIYNIKKEESIILTKWNDAMEELSDSMNYSGTEGITINGEDVIAVMKFNLMNKSVPILVGTSNHVLKKGAGWSEYSSTFGEDGNCMIFGHRDSVFRFLKDIKIGDELTIETINNLYSYEVVNIEIVNPNDIVISKGEGAHKLKLITCYPFRYVGNAPQRFIVTASLKE